MKRLLLVLPFVIAACDGGSTAPTSPAMARVNAGAISLGVNAKNTCTVPIRGVLTVVAVGYDSYGYNRCAEIFNGTFAGYCAEQGAPADCAGFLGSTSLIMKWNAEWDRGNAEKWSKPPYAANLDNEIKGSLLDGTPFSEHLKVTWDAGCAAGTPAAGATCIWGPFLVLMDQGTQDGAHIWWTKWTPAGYGS